jgi:polar amino acid transport system substrate-binding protein
MVPASIAQAGVVATPVDSDYPPFEFLGKNGKETGLSADLMYEAFKLLGLKPDVKIVSFDAILPGFAAKRYVLSMASINVTPERSKVVDFVTYFKGGDAFYEKSSASGKLPGAYTAACGHTVAVEQGSEQASTLQDLKCPSGKSANVQQYPNQAAVNLAVTSGRAELGLADNTTVGYLIKSTGNRFKLAGPAFNFTSITGWAMSKDSGLAKPLQAALAYMIQHGTYQKLFQKWGMQTGELSTPKVVS